MILVDATTLISLGQIGELDLLLSFERAPAVLPVVRREVTSAPANTNLEDFLGREDVLGEDRLPFSSDGPDESVRPVVERAMEMLGESEYHGDVELVATVMVDANADAPKPTVISDDRRVRTICGGLGASVTGTIGVVVRAVTTGEATASEGKAIVRRIDGQGLHMTGELRETADDLIEGAANENE